MHTLSTIPEIETIRLFGSRAMGNAKPGSDIDLALMGPLLTKQILQQLQSTLNERLPIPYHIDLLHYDTLHNPALKQHSDSKGITLHL